MISDQPWSKGRYYIIPNPIDIDRFSLKQFGKKEFLDIYYIGRLVETKGVDLLLEAISIISDEEFFKQIRFYIVGEGPMEDRVKELFSKHKNCFYLGFRKDIPELLKKVDLLILPSRYESFSYVVAEAQSEGVIVLSSNIEGPKDILNDNLTGWFFESGNTEDLAQKITTIYHFWKSDYTKIENMGLAARENIRNKFEIDVVNEKMEQMLLDTKYENSI
jgi:galacturonosyltransferase